MRLRKKTAVRTSVLSGAAEPPAVYSLRAASTNSIPVSYTHLTLPTKA